MNNHEKFQLISNESNVGEESQVSSLDLVNDEISSNLLSNQSVLPPLSSSLVRQFARIADKVEKRNPDDKDLIQILKSPDLILLATLQGLAITFVCSTEIPIHGMIGLAQKAINSLRK